MSITAIYPGTFDPITLGHVDIVSRAAPMFGELILAVAGSTSKNTVFSADERVELAANVLSRFPNVRIMKFEGLMVDFAKKNGASIILRGLRAVSDFEYEFQMVGMNARLNPEIETVFLMASERHQFIASRLVKEIAILGGEIHQFVPPRVETRVRTAIARNK